MGACCGKSKNGDTSAELWFAVKIGVGKKEGVVDVHHVGGEGEHGKGFSRAGEVEVEEKVDGKEGNRRLGDDIYYCVAGPEGKLYSSVRPPC